MAAGRASFTLDRLFVEVFEVSANDGSELHKVSIPVLPATRMVKGYIGYREHVVKQGDTLTKIARSTTATRTSSRSCAPTSTRSTIRT